MNIYLIEYNYKNNLLGFRKKVLVKADSSINAIEKWKGFNKDKIEFSDILNFEISKFCNADHLIV